MSEFKREVRYTVIKHDQLTDAQIGFLKNCIHGEGIPTVKAVVVESDWPEYEPVWRMIEDRISGAPVEGGKAEYDAMAAVLAQEAGPVVERKETAAPFGYWLAPKYQPGLGRFHRVTPDDAIIDSEAVVGYFDITPLYTSPTEPVAVVLPARRYIFENDYDDEDRSYSMGWNACLDKVKELNQ